MSGQRLTSRDYKRPPRRQLALDLARWREFGAGLAIGLAAAGIVWVTDHRTPEAAPAERPVPRHGTAATASGTDAAGGDATAGDPSAVSEGSYDFYHMLPQFEVVVPEKEHGSRLAPTAPIDRPGTYFLQAGSYRDAAVAERIRAQLAKLGIDATVQRVAVDADVWHRVRIGPIKDLGRLNRMRARLQQSNLDALVVRVDE